MVTTGRFPEMNSKRGLSQPDPEETVDACSMDVRSCGESSLIQLPPNTYR